jgi:spermidine synthase
MEPTPTVDHPPGVTAETRESHLVHAAIRLVVVLCLFSSLILALLPLADRFVGIAGQDSLANRLRIGGAWSFGFFVEAVLLVSGAIVVTLALRYALRRLEPFLDASAAAQARFLDTLKSKYVDVAIVSAAALSLVLELAVIRWHGSVLEFLAFYKNFSLLACFAGLGLGYALANRSRIPLLLVIPMLGWQFVFMIMIRQRPGFFSVIPFREQLSMGVATGLVGVRVPVLYVLLAVLFLLTALTFLPVGQLCGRLMERRPKLRAYGLNLLGSVVGVLLMLAISFLWAPPLVWFALCFLAILLFTERRLPVLVTGIVFTTVCVVALAWWPVDRMLNRVYSPYQLLEIGANAATGWPEIRAAGHYYQRIYDFSGQPLPAHLVSARNYYDFPYRATSHLDDVAVVGSGTGNDIAAALRAGAKRVDGVEIDPAIMLIGKTVHPEKPYSDPRTNAINDDARTFFRRTQRRYDLIVYGLLDSHTLLTQGSSVRLDSFVYTVEGLAEARSRLKPGGTISLSYSVLSPELGRKIYLMLQQVFDGRPPTVVRAGYDEGIIFLESNDPDWQLSPTLLKETGFADKTRVFADSTLKADVSTDDWPFFYMPRRIYPTSYLIMIFLVLVLSVVLAGNFFSEAPKFSDMSFFWLGVGFMLIETKNITEMGLTFGNTWQVIGIVITAILVMAFLGNYFVDRMNIRRPLPWFVFLWGTLAAGWLISQSGGFASTPVGRAQTALVLASPFFFSGIVFSTLLSSTSGTVSSAMAMNLLGAICGGLLEYNSMYFGFRSLYIVAIASYFLAFLSSLVFPKGYRTRETMKVSASGVPAAPAKAPPGS